MGQPGQVNAWSFPNLFEGFGKPTRGSETSQYPEEKKSTEIPQVAASERGEAQTWRLRPSGVVGRSTADRAVSNSNGFGKAGHRG